MPILGGSPLGLISTLSGKVGGATSFNSDYDKRMSVDAYNRGDAWVSGNEKGNSLFSGQRITRAFPSEDLLLKDTGLQTEAELTFNPQAKDDNDFRPRARGKLHNNDVYDTSIVNIIRKVNKTHAKLKTTDFAYLKDVGVYSNNRLIICRRFAGPIGDNIFRNIGKGVGPVATVISYFDSEAFPLKLSFGEKWEEAPASFKDILDQIGSDVSSKFTSTGSVVESVGGALPLPGFTEVFQRQFLTRIGVLEDTKTVLVPSGNPNLIKEAKMRTTIGYEIAGSGLSCECSIAVTCEYEQKFISGLDPTLVWMDIMGNITRFATSPSVRYGLSSGFAKNIQALLNNPMDWIRNVIEKIGKSLQDVANQIVTQLFNAYKETRDLLKAQKENKDQKPEDESDESILERAKAAGGVVMSKIGNFLRNAMKGMAYKYRVKIMGAVHSLTGMPSTPWHITIGNPLRPIFCSGDMLTQNVSLELGPTLAFNDLPSSIKISFELKNARAWGLQEIMAKFNSGYIRTTDVQRTLLETTSFDKKDPKDPNKTIHTDETPGNFPFESKVYDELEEENKKIDEENARKEAEQNNTVVNSGSGTETERLKREAEDKVRKEAEEKEKNGALTPEQIKAAEEKKRQEEAKNAEDAQKLSGGDKSLTEIKEGSGQKSAEDMAKEQALKAIENIKTSKVAGDKKELSDADLNALLGGLDQGIPSLK